MTRCRHCGTTWTGLRLAHCAECHRTFSSVSTFDKHRARKQSGSKGEKRVILREYGQCYDPADDSMVQNDRGHWAMPNDGAYDFKPSGDAA